MKDGFTMIVAGVCIICAIVGAIDAGLVYENGDMAKLKILLAGILLGVGVLLANDVW